MEVRYEGRDEREEGRDEPLVVEISLVADENDDNIVTTLGTDIVDPLGSVHERGAV